MQVAPPVFFARAEPAYRPQVTVRRRRKSGASRRPGPPVASKNPVLRGKPWIYACRREARDFRTPRVKPCMARTESQADGMFGRDKCCRSEGRALGDGIAPFLVPQISLLKSCGDSRPDLAASEGVYRTAEPIGYPCTPASEALPPLLDMAPLTRAPVGLQPTRSGRCPAHTMTPSDFSPACMFIVRFYPS